MAGEGNGDEGWRRSGIEVSALQFGYDGQPPLFARFNLRIGPGSRCLLVGANGSGKTTLLKILAGKHMVGGRDVVRVLNGSAFHDTQLVCNGDLSYLGGSWSRTIGSAVLLLDEITVDLDVVTRMDLLDFFKEECEQREATIVYATHIFNGLETWATDIACIQEGELRKSAKYSDVEELRSAKNLLSVVESWLRSETKLPHSETQPWRSSPFDSSPFRSSRHMAYYRC